MANFENRSAAYIEVREHRKRRNPPFAGRHHLNLNTPEAGQQRRNSIQLTSESSPMIGSGLIGTGFMGKCHALAWNSVGTVFGDTPEIKLVHLGEMTRELAERRAREFGFAKASADWRAVVEDPAVDVVSITTPNQ